MQSYRSNLAYVVPFTLPAMGMALFGLVLGYIAIFGVGAKGAVVERLCILLGAGFCLACGLALVRVAFRGVYLALSMDEHGLYFHQLSRKWAVEWAAVKYLSRTDSTLVIHTNAEQIEIGADLIGFEPFCQAVTAAVEARPKPEPAPRGLRGPG